MKENNIPAHDSKNKDNEIDISKMAGKVGGNMTNTAGTSNFNSNKNKGEGAGRADK